MKFAALTTTLCLALLLTACLSRAEAPKKPTDKESLYYETLKAHSVVAIHGTGTAEAVLVTDPMCGHCRIAHMFFHDHPELFSTLHLVFMPRASYSGGDMAAWIAEDMADSKFLPGVLDFLFEMLHSPESREPEAARLDVLEQFLKAYNVTDSKVTPQDLMARLEREHAEHAAQGTKLAREAGLPGTPILMTANRAIMGFSPGHWSAVLNGEE